MSDKTEPEAPTVASPLRDRDVARLRAVLADSQDDMFGEVFELVREAGAGGMGKVYEAIERATTRRVAIKVITGLAGPSALARFAAETEVLERLDHPAIVDYVAHGETSDGEPYLAMEWLTGESLSQRLERERLSITEAVILGERIADALDHAHDAGVVHRDLKPSNIFLVEGKAAEAHLIDFGVAKQADRDLTHTGQLIGTPGYMAPEQVRGHKTVNAAADLFALGCVLYKAVSGKDAFAGAEVMEILARLLLEDPEPIDNLVSDLPPRFVHLIGSLLSKDPTRRLGDAAIVVAELREIRRALDARDAAALALRPDAIPTPVPAGDSTLPDGPLSLHRDYHRRRSWWFVVAGVVVAASLVTVIVVLTRDPEAPPPTPTPVVTPQPRPPAPPATCSAGRVDVCEAKCKAGDAATCHFYAVILHNKDDHNPELENHEKARELDVRACELGDNAGCGAAAVSLIAVATKHTADATAKRLMLEKAERMYVTACERDDLVTCQSFARKLSKGQGGPFPPDPPRAFELMIGICAKEHPPACEQLLVMAGDPNNGATPALRNQARQAWAAACERTIKGLDCGGPQHQPAKPAQGSAAKRAPDSGTAAPK